MFREGFMRFYPYLTVRDAYKLADQTIRTWRRYEREGDEALAHHNELTINSMLTSRGKLHFGFVDICPDCNGTGIVFADVGSCESGPIMKEFLCDCQDD